MNLQDYQKESLLPIFVLYAMDELTWELSEVPPGHASFWCNICEQEMEKTEPVVCCLGVSMLMHRSCLNRSLRGPNTKLLKESFLDCFTIVNRARCWLQKPHSQTVSTQGQVGRRKLGIFGNNYKQVSATLSAHFRNSSLKKMDPAIFDR